MYNGKQKNRIFIIIAEKMNVEVYIFYHRSRIRRRSEFQHTTARKNKRTMEQTSKKTNGRTYTKHRGILEGTVKYHLL